MRYHIPSEDLTYETLEFLPRMADFANAQELRRYLINNLPQNSLKTRERYASYLIARFCPTGSTVSPLTEFAKKFKDRPDLKDVALYHYATRERIVGDFLAEVMYSKLDSGELEKGAALAFVSRFFEKQETRRKLEARIIGSLRKFQVVSGRKDTLRFSERKLHMGSFLYFLHLNFPEPSMHHIEAIFKTRFPFIMLWGEAQIEEALKAAWKEGNLSKISDIDGLRQFTTLYRFEDLLEIIPR